MIKQIISYIGAPLFGWLELFVLKSTFKKSISERDLAPVHFEYRPEGAYEDFQKVWSHEKKRRNPKLWRTFLYLFYKHLIFSGVLNFCSLTIEICLPLLVGVFIEILECHGSSHRTLKLFGIALGIYIMSILRSILQQNVFARLSILGIKYRNILTSAIYHRLLLFSHDQIHNISYGKLITPISLGLYKLDLGIMFVHYLWLYPYALILFTFLLWSEIGWFALTASFVALLQIPLGMVLGFYITRLRLEIARVTDTRNKVMREVIEGIRIIKTFAWEFAVRNFVGSIRKSEFRKYLTSSLLKVGGSILGATFPISGGIVCLSLYAFAGGEFTAARVFTVVTLLRSFRHPNLLLGNAIINCSEIYSIIKRVQTVLEGKEFLRVDGKDEETAQSPFIRLNDFSCGWRADREKESVVSKVSFSVKPGEILTIVGSVGSGKSSLLMGLIDENVPIDGTKSICGSKAITLQEPWVFSDTIRENIIFGTQFEPVWFEKVVQACCLEDDIKSFMKGEETVVGERGITLSGGQKARISLARAVYADRDIYLLDDPLSAVDSIVAERLYRECIRGLLHDKIVVLVTHQLRFIHDSDLVLVLDRGEPQCIGSYTEVIDHPSCKEIFEKVRDEPTQNIEDSTVELDNEFASPLGIEDSPNKKLTLSLISLPTTEDVERESLIEKLEDHENNLSAEKNEKGTVSFKAYLIFFWKGAHIFGPLLLIVIMLSQLLGDIGFNYYLVLWTSLTEVNITNNSICDIPQINSNTTSNSPAGYNPLANTVTHERVLIFISLGVSSIILYYVGYSLLYSAFLNASRRLHDTILWKILRVPMRFFDINQSGSVINRFSKDVGTLDDIIPLLGVNFFYSILIFIYTLISAIISQWIVIFPSLILIILLLLYRSYYLRISRQVKRMESAANSPILTHISTTLHGLPCIHTLQLESLLTRKFYSYQQAHYHIWTTDQMLARWFGLRIDLLLSFYVLLVQTVYIIMSETVNPGNVAFSIAFLLSISGSVQFCIRTSAQIETFMVAAERILAYSKLPEEPPLYSKKTNFHICRGEIVFRNVTLRYSPHLPNVLKQLNINIKAGQKVGIVGRTGAGKSSLQVALFRLVELSSGSILIDGTNISTVGLHDLRSQISIIPQDPILFSGPIRRTLDPFNEYTDTDLWNVLEQVQLKDKVIGLEGQLQFTVSDAGSNFSVGEKQLFCLARALVRNNKVLMLDEATSNVDMLTDSIIQRIIRTQFKDATVLMIAHRLNTIIDADSIIVMGNGRVKEYGTPWLMLQDPNGYLARLVNKTGSEAAGLLKEAETCYRKKSVNCQPN